MLFSANPVLTSVGVLPPASIQKMLDYLVMCIRSLFGGDIAKVDFSQMLHIQYVLIQHGQSEELYGTLAAEVKQTVELVAQRLVESQTNLAPNDWITVLASTWRHFLHVVENLRTICPHLDAMVAVFDRQSVADYALELWHETILLSNDTLQAISDRVVDNFNLTRDTSGLKISGPILTLANMLHLTDPLANTSGLACIQNNYITNIRIVLGKRRTKLLQQYQRLDALFEQVQMEHMGLSELDQVGVLVKTIQKMNFESEQRARANNTPYNADSSMFDSDKPTAGRPEGYELSYVVNYCHKVEFWVAQELSLAQQILSTSTCHMIKTILYEELVKDAAPVLILDWVDGLLYHVKQHNTPQVKLIFQTLITGGVPLDEILQHIKEYFQSETSRLTQHCIASSSADDGNKDKTSTAPKQHNCIVLVNSLHHLYDQHISIVHQACESNLELIQCINESFVSAVSASASIPRLLAEYIDLLLRTTVNTLSLTHPNRYAAGNFVLGNLRKAGPETFASLQLSQASPHNPHVVTAQQKILAEFDAGVTKWLALVEILVDQDIYEAEHRTLTTDRLFSQLHNNSHYTMKDFQTWSTTLKTALQQIRATKSATDRQLLPRGATAEKINHNLLGAALRQLNDTKENNFIQLMLQCSTSPHLPLFLLLEGYVWENLQLVANPQQLPLHFMEGLLRDYTRSAELSITYNKDEFYQDALTIYSGTMARQRAEDMKAEPNNNSIVENDDDIDDTAMSDAIATTKTTTTTTTPTITTTAKNILNDLPTAYPLPQDRKDDYGAFLPHLTPTILTHGVWNNTLSPVIDSSLLPAVNYNATNLKSTQTMAPILLKTSNAYYPTLNVPPEVSSLLATLQENYCLHKRVGRKVIWNYEAFTAIVVATFHHPEQQKVQQVELVCNFFQFLILNLFNHKTKLSYTYDEIAELTGIIQAQRAADTELQLNTSLLSLIHPRVGVLKKHPDRPVFAPDDVFTWNHRFQSAAHRFHIPKANVQAFKIQQDKFNEKTKTTKQTAAQQTGAVGGDNANNLVNQAIFRRETAVDAAIVRILKKEQEMKHAELIAKVQGDLKHIFVPDEVFIKHRIERQIDEWNIERDGDDRNLYRYLAD